MVEARHTKSKFFTKVGERTSDRIDDGQCACERVSKDGRVLGENLSSEDHKELGAEQEDS